MPVAEMLAQEAGRGDPLRRTVLGLRRARRRSTPTLLTAGVPGASGMCYGFQAMAQALGGTVAHTGLASTAHTPAAVSDTASTLFNGQPADAVGVDVATATR